MPRTGLKVSVVGGWWCKVIIASNPTSIVVKLGWVEVVVGVVTAIFFYNNSPSVGIILSILIKDVKVYFLIKRYRAIRNWLQYFESEKNDNIYEFIDSMCLVDFKPLIMRGTSDNFLFTLHHHISFDYKWLYCESEIFPPKSFWLFSLKFFLEKLSAVKSDPVMYTFELQNVAWVKKWWGDWNTCLDYKQFFR